MIVTAGMALISGIALALAGPPILDWSYGERLATGAGSRQRHPVSGEVDAPGRPGRFNRGRLGRSMHGALDWRAGLLFLGSALAAGGSLHLNATAADRALTFGATLAFLLLSVSDLERRLLPNRLMYPFLSAALLLAPAWSNRGLLDALSGAGLGFVLMLVAFLCMPRALAAGDVKFAALIGAVMGIPDVVLALAAGVMLGGFGAAAMLIRGGRRAYMPYGPFLSAGGIVALWIGVGW